MWFVKKNFYISNYVTRGMVTNDMSLKRLISKVYNEKQNKQPFFFKDLNQILSYLKETKKIS